MPAKRAGDDVEGSARKRVASGQTARTGQACNRCKLRKIKCDARPGGCSPCLQNNTECTTTDRITGRAVSRGHTETIENENATLRLYTEELQQQLRDNGLEPKQAPVVQHDCVPTTSMWTEDSQQPGSWGDLNSAGGFASSSSGRDARTSLPSVLPDFRPGCIGDNYLGVSISNDWLSPIAGTRLSLFGITLDLAEFLPAELESTSDPTSYHAFLKTAFGRAAPVPKPPLPPLEVCRQYADWFFKSVQVFTPVLHRPDFMKLLTHMHGGPYEPTPPETVMVHMVIAIIMFQAALRNVTSDDLRNQSMAHYLYAITFVPDLMIGHQLVHVQALALICLQLRQQPRLGAAWTFSKAVIDLAIELGLHRSATSWKSTTSERDPCVVEMRKRVFWSLLVINVTVGGKLGRPMPLRIQDFDIEMPDLVNDSLPGETNLTKWQKCSFRAALPGMKLLKILMQVYATVYSVRTDTTPYEMSVRRLEKELEIFRGQLPAEISGGPETVEEDRCPALYLQMAEEEIRLVLHHPSVHAGSSDGSAKNLDVCLDASKNLLLTASKLQAIQSLDTTWYYSTDYLAAIFTTLFVWTQRRDRMSSADFQQLRVDMDKWLDIMGDVGILLGTGYRLRERLRSIIEPRIAIISHHLAAKTASAGLASAESSISPTNGHPHIQPAPQAQPPPQPQQIYTPTNGYPSQYHERAHSNDFSNSAPPGYAVPVQHQHQQSPYPPPGYYSEPTSATIPHYPGMGSFDASTYQAEDAKHAITNPLPMTQPLATQPPPPQHTPPHPHHQQQQHAAPPPPPPPPPYLTAFSIPSPVQQNGYHSHPLPQHTQHPQHQQPVAQQMVYPGQQAWRGFAVDMMTDLSGADYMSSANALMSLGGAGPGEDSKAHLGMGLGMGVGEEVQQGGWPLVQYGGSQ